MFVQPNAGKPEFVNGETKFNMTPEEFLSGIIECINAGANMIGGCCGTGPEHIRVVYDYISKI